ncbi:MULTISPECIES: cation diffusion facilitator family transporter [Dysgonomonas]|uniref:cation diffusion facilitator family transporter n=1 Tax=Dysgonomonas TaxID=156973 RepID=UPI0029246D22|nr:cation diffusion facilitator family transporter [Dysgonomonas capnocytophagoides]
MSDNHTHTHNHGAHSHGHNANKKALTISFCLIAGFMLVEFVGGILTNSLALLSDAGHMLSDAVALGLSLAALIFGERAATLDKTYGYKRFEILAALLNGIALVALSIYILYEAIVRLSSPPSVIGKGMIIISAIGLVINIVVAWILSRGETKENLNIKSAFMHVLGDLLGSVGAIIAALLIIFLGWNIADPIASMIVSVLVLYSGWHILKDSVNILMESKPANIDTAEVKRAIKSIDGVIDIHDLHIWMITQEFLSLTTHVSVKNNSDRDLLLNQITKIIKQKTGITHITVQLEGLDFAICEHACDMKH